MPGKTLHLITVVVQHALGNQVIDASLKAGATGATYFLAQGTGVRQTLGEAAQNIEVDKRVITILVDSTKTDAVLKAVIAAGKLDTPGGGVAYVQEVVKAVGFMPPK